MTNARGDELLLPDSRQSGERGTWRLPTTTSTDDDVEDGVLTIEARFLGLGGSRLSRHDPHPGRFAVGGARCPYCRWFETRIFRLGPNDYVLHHAGRSIVPGESQLCRHERAFSPQEVLELYTVRHVHENRAFLTRPAARALAQACAFDDDLRDAYENRAVI
jgi:hypothetical protein